MFDKVRDEKHTKETLQYFLGYTSNTANFAEPYRHYDKHKIFEEVDDPASGGTEILRLTKKAFASEASYLAYITSHENLEVKKIPEEETQVGYNDTPARLKDDHAHEDEPTEVAEV